MSDIDDIDSVDSRDIECPSMSVSSRFIPTMDIINQPSAPPPLSSAPINGWSSEYVNTLTTWKQKLVKTSYIYDYVMEKYKKRLDRLLVIIAIMTGIGSLLSSIASALIVPTNTDNTTQITNTTVINNTKTTSPYYWVIFGLMVITSVCSAIGALLSYIIKLKQYGPYCETISRCITKVDSLYTILDNQSTIPYADRENASTFIQKYNVEMINIINTLPNISPSDYEEANNEFIRNAYSPTNVKVDMRIN